MAFQKLGNVPIPAQDRIARPKRPQYGDRPDPQEGLITEPWHNSLTHLWTVTGQAPNRLNSVFVTDQDASIAATDISGGVLTAGRYQLSYYMRVVRAAGVSSSLTISFAFVDGGVVIPLSGAAMTGNTTDTVQSGIFGIRIDHNAPVTYATTYGTAGAPTMLYSLDVTLTLISA